MRLLTPPARRPLPYPRGRYSRAQLAGMLDAVERERDFAVGQARAIREALCSWLEGLADAHDLDARHEKTAETRRLVHRMVADDLRQAAGDARSVQVGQPADDDAERVPA